MRKFILVFLVALVALVTYSQERTVTKRMDVGSYTILAYGQVLDALVPTTRDTIDYIFQYRADDYIKKLSVRTQFDTIAKADTTVKITVDGKEYLDDASWVSIIGSTTTAEITSLKTHVVNSDYVYGVGAFDAILKQQTTTNSDTISYPAQVITPFDKTYQWYRVRYILTGNDHVGAGVKIKEIQLKLFK